MMTRVDMRGECHSVGEVVARRGMRATTIKRGNRKNNQIAATVSSGKSFG